MWILLGRLVHRLFTLGGMLHLCQDTRCETLQRQNMSPATGDITGIIHLNNSKSVTNVRIKKTTATV